jgi:hypothetical protein
MPFLESCPHCGANVLFNGTICPNCSLDCNNPDATKLEQLLSSRKRVEKAVRRPASAWWKPVVVLLFLATLASSLYQPNVFTLLVAGIGVVTGLLAMRKGYDFFLWALASGVVGLIVLAFLPFAIKPDHIRSRPCCSSSGCFCRCTD